MPMPAAASAATSAQKRGFDSSPVLTGSVFFVVLLRVVVVVVVRDVVVVVGAAVVEVVGSVVEEVG